MDIAGFKDNRDPSTRTASLQFQFCLFPFWDGGLYLTVNPAMLMLRISLCVIDFRVWLNIRRIKQPGIESVNSKLLFMQQIPPDIREPDEAIYFGASTGNICHYIVHAVWDSQPGEADCKELEEAVVVKGPQ